MYFCPEKTTTMYRGKSTCKVLKEVRREIARANGIPLEERECTHKGDCAGTCPYCEAEVRYLERELSKRKNLGKAVAVAGIALSAVTMAGCATSEPASTTSDNASNTSLEDISWDDFEMGEIVTVRKHHSRRDKSGKKKAKKTQKCDTLQLEGIVPAPDSVRSDLIESVLPDDAIWDDSETTVGIVEDDDLSLYNRQPVKEFKPKSIEGYEDATFPEEYGTPASWLRSKLPEFNTYIQQPRMDEVKIRFFVETDGRVSSVMIVDYKDEVGMADGNFLDAVNKAMLSMPHWNPASIKGKPVSALMTINVRDLR